MNEPTNTTEVIEAELVETSPGLDLLGLPAMMGSVAAMLGIDLEALATDEGAITFDELCEAVDELRETVTALVELLAPVVELAKAAKANAPKLRKFGIVL